MSRILIISFFCIITAVALFLAVKLHNNSQLDKIYKYDYFTVNQIKYGLLSGDKWTFQVNTIIAHQIDSFNLTGQNKDLLKVQINKILARLFDEVDAVLHKKKGETNGQNKILCH